MSCFSKSKYLCLLFVGSLSTPVVAQESTGEEGDVIIIDEGRAFTDGDTTITVIGSRLDSGQSNASISLIQEEDFARQQSVPVTDLLQRLPGVTVTRNGTLGGFTGVRIRGADAEQTLVVINGVRVADPTSPGGGFDFGSLLSGNIDTIEVLRGANSVPWGSQAIGGVVAITTTRPRANINDPTELAWSSEYGAHDLARVNARLRTHEFPLGSIGFAAGYTRTDGISSAASGTERDGFRQFSANFNSSTRLGGAISLRTFGLIADSRLELDGFAPPTFSFGDTEEYQESREHYGAVTLAHDISGNSADNFTMSQAISLSIADVNRDNFNPAFGSAPDFVARGRTERISYSAQIQPIGTHGGGWNTTDLLIVLGAEREWSRSLTASAFTSDRGRTRTNGLFAQIVGRPLRGLSVTGGVRHEDHRSFGGNTSFSLDAGYAHDGWGLRASYREGFKAPTLFQLSGTAGAFGNPALQPELARSYEIGLVTGNTGVWWFDAAIFRRDSRNLIDFVSCPAGPNPQPAICAGGARPFGTYDNIRLARAEGIEVEFGYALNSNFTVEANYSHVASRDRTAGSALAGNVLARRPGHSANAELRWEGDEGWTGTAASVAIRYVGASFDDRANSIRLADYLLLDVRASHEITEAIELYGRIENLFDADYQNVAGYGTFGRTFAIGVRARL